MSAVPQPVVAIDVGSGMTKFVIGLYKRDDETANIDVMEQLERPIPYGVDWKQSSDDKLSEDIQRQGLELFKEIQSIISNWKDTYSSEYPNIDILAVGTEVFRKAKNGEIFLNRVENETGLKIKLISQELEAELGFLTGEAALMTIDNKSLSQLDYHSDKDLVVYDSGGGSFQITWKNPSKKSRSNLKPSSQHSCKEKLNTVLKPNGLAPTLYDLLVLQNKDQKDTPNPVSYKTAITLVDDLIKKFIEPVELEQLNKDDFDPMFLSIGGINSHTRLATDILIRIQEERELENVNINKDTGLNTPNSFYFTEQSLTQALKRICEKEDNELEIFAKYPNAEPTSYMVPKICILLSAVKGYKIPRLNWIMCCGSCFGLILNHVQEKSDKTE